MGLLDDPNQAALLQLGLGLLSAGGPFLRPVSMGQALGQAGQGAIGAYQQTKAANLQDQLRQLQMQQSLLQLEAMKKQRADETAQQQFFGRVGDYMRSPEQQAIGAGGPTPQAAAMIPKLQPQFDRQAMLRDMLKVPGLGATALGALNKEDETVVVPEGGILANKRTGSQLFQNPKDEKLPWYVKRSPDGRTVIDPAYADFEKAKASAGRPASPYFQFIPTPTGIVAGNARTGTVAPVSLNGQPVVKSSDDPNLQGRIAEAEKLGAKTGEQKALLQGKRDALDSVGEAKKMLNTGINAGYYANLKQFAGKALPGGDKETAARTEEFKSHIGNIVIPRLQEFGGNDSNEELRYLQGVMGGDITMEPQALKRVLESAEKKIQAGIARLETPGTQGKTVTRRGRYNGRQVIQYSDGSIDYAD